MENNSIKRMALIIAAGGSPNAYDLLRSLGMAGIPCCVMSSQKNDIMFFSRYCREKIVLPPFQEHNDRDILNALKIYGSGCSEKPVLFYSSDPELRFVCKFRKELEKYFLFLLPPEEIVELLFSKVEFSRFAEAQSIPVPRSILCHSSKDLETKLDHVPFPCIVKPAYSEDWHWKTDAQRAKFGWYKSALRRFETRDELIEFCRDLPENPSGFLIQEFVDGRDESIYSFHGYFDDHSECLAFFIGRKIRTYPIHTGGSSYIRTVYDSELADLSIRILQKMEYRGIVKIDWKLDRKEDRFKVLEINTRYSLWQLLGAHAGINLAATAYKHLSGRPCLVEGQYMDDVRLLYARRDLRAFPDYVKAGEWNLASYVRSLKGKKSYCVWDSHDPGPFVVSALGYAAQKFRHLMRRAFRTNSSLAPVESSGVKKDLRFVQAIKMEK